MDIYQKSSTVERHGVILSGISIRRLKVTLGSKQMHFENQYDEQRLAYVILQEVIP